MRLSTEERIAEIESLKSEFLEFIKDFKFSKSIYFYRKAINDTSLTMKEYVMKGEMPTRETIRDTFKVCVAISLTRFENLQRINSIEELLGFRR